MKIKGKTNTLENEEKTKEKWRFFHCFFDFWLCYVSAFIVHNLWTFLNTEEVEDMRKVKKAKLLCKENENQRKKNGRKSLRLHKKSQNNNKKTWKKIHKNFGLFDFLTAMFFIYILYKSYIYQNIDVYRCILCIKAQIFSLDGWMDGWMKELKVKEGNNLEKCFGDFCGKIKVEAENHNLLIIKSIGNTNYSCLDFMSGRI